MFLFRSSRDRATVSESRCPRNPPSDSFNPDRKRFKGVSIDSSGNTAEKDDWALGSEEIDILVLRCSSPIEWLDPILFAFLELSSDVVELLNK